MENNTNENIKLCLSKFNYTYLEQGNNIRVTHFKPLFIDICINENIIQMTPKLIGWNILTGINDMNFEKVSSYLKRMAILHVFFIIALYIYIQYRDINIDNNMLLLFFSLFIIILFSMCFSYFDLKIKYESFQINLLLNLKK